MDYNYHTHTSRCSHASGSMEEYVLRAIEGGIKYMGFSDHMPFMYPDGKEAGFRVPIAQAKEYVAEAIGLREKYRDCTNINVGFEMEYYASHFEEMLRSAVEYGAEYLILGQHHVNLETFLQTKRSSYANWASDEELSDYVRSVTEAMRTGVFTYVAHPDVIRYNGSEQTYAEQMRRICIASVETGTPLEINFLGIREKRDYPREDFWKLAGEYGCPVTFGFDAHNVQSAYDGESLLVAMGLVKRYKLNYIGRPPLMSVADKASKLL